MPDVNAYIFKEGIVFDGDGSQNQRARDAVIADMNAPSFAKGFVQFVAMTVINKCAFKAAIIVHFGNAPGPFGFHLRQEDYRRAGSQQRNATAKS